MREDEGCKKKTNRVHRCTRSLAKKLIRKVVSTIILQKAGVNKSHESNSIVQSYTLCK